MTNLDSIFKSRDITLPKKVHLVKAMVFPVVNLIKADLYEKTEQGHPEAETLPPSVTLPPPRPAVQEAEMAWLLSRQERPSG